MGEIQGRRLTGQFATACAHPVCCRIPGLTHDSLNRLACAPSCEGAGLHLCAACEANSLRGRYLLNRLCGLKKRNAWRLSAQSVIGKLHLCRRDDLAGGVVDLYRVLRFKRAIAQAVKNVDKVVTDSSLHALAFALHLAAYS